MRKSSGFDFHPWAPRGYPRHRSTDTVVFLPVPHGWVLIGIGGMFSKGYSL